MKIKIILNKSDQTAIKNFTRENKNPFVARRIQRNVNGQIKKVTKNSIIKSMFMCLLTSQQKSGPKTAVGKFLQSSRFPFTYASISKMHNHKKFIKDTLLNNGLKRFVNNIVEYFLYNYTILRETDWKIVTELNKFRHTSTKKNERQLADRIEITFKGFGPKQARNFLQILGLTKYEIPIDSRIIKWLKENEFPIPISSALLQNTEYYHFVLDIIQELCRQAKILPCVLDAAIFSSYDDDQWTETTVIF